ncbi:uncharacterized protein ACA1_209420 [Acanthamoeba castellanii str. Neff]|uniref:EF-hand domain-containing protein n=1 Tax=Acanthamoeba castellanii (strain ATCC 30010 / Neff) TaxID=1257118 RepID=L8GYG3_ACACF|nr:uncharacterized protein ACA1_209420 [Acanthamoeba castellanii str. Neff]ELR17997.1 hypothetical protein ACA1_209420 [Acanthamoeba castellanii str. Neff]
MVNWFGTELGMDRVEEAVNLFDKWDTRGSGRLNKAQFLRLMQQVIGANKFARGPIYQRLVELSFDYVDTGKKGSLDKRQFLISYNLLFSNERKQMALLLTKDFKGLTVEEIEDGLKKFEQQEKVDMDEFYQLKEELDDNLKRILKQILNIVEPGAADTKIVSALKTSLECLPVEEVKPSTPVTATAATSTAPRPVGQAPPSQRALKKACGVDADLQGVEVFNIIKTKVEYQTGFKASPPRAVIVGSGPGGLRTAIEFAFLGVRATVLEKRLDYSRNNLLHIWHSSIRDLKNIGAKYFYPQFCTGGINHIAIRSLQILLLKVALLLGVKFLPGVGYVKTDDSRHRAKPQSGLWQVVVAAQGKPDFVDYRDDDLAANIIVGADGENSLVAKDFEFERKVLQGSRAIGITANFVNTHTSAENQIKEFGILRVYNQQFFNDLNTKYGIDLENLVYYRGETHYFVMTAMIKSLLDKKVLREMQTDASLLLSRDNLDVQKLRSFVTEVADHTGLPSTCPFAPNHAGAEDVAIFDFSKKQQSITPFKIVGDQEGNKLLVALVGDALIEPFWPLGTGANRAILSALDTTWMVKGMYGNGAKQVSCAQLKQLETQWQDSFKIMMNSSPDDLVSNFGLHTIDPKTRYKKNSMSRFH